MSDAMQVAKQRHKEYEASVAKKEAEIEELNELIADLESFMEFGDALIGKTPAATPAKKTVVSRPVVQVTKPVTEPKNEWDNDDDDKAGDKNDDNDGISRVLSQRIG